MLRRRTDITVGQNILLVWLDKNIDDNSSDFQNMVTQLQRVVNTVNKFTNTDRCIDFLTDHYNEKATMIISGALCRNTVPLIHDIDQLDVIFILCKNKRKHEEWANEWSKIKGVFTEIGPICDTFKQVTQQCEQNSIAISFIPTTGDMSTKNLDQLDCSFMYTQIMKEILLSIKFEPTHIREFINYCRDVFAGNEEELNDMKELEQKYHQKTPIWWYTSDYFLYSMLKRALRLMDADIIIKMAYFLCDLHRHIEQLHSEQFKGHQFNTTFTVYRGQGLSNTDFLQMKKTIGGLISFNNFISTSKDHDVSLVFAESNQSNSDSVGILFAIVIDPSISATPFASIANASCFQTEDEILFSMHSVFRIDDIKPMDENNRLFRVDLILTSDNDKELRALTDRVLQETKESTGWFRLGELLRRMGQFDKAEQLYIVLLEQSTNDKERAPIYHQLGWMKDSLGSYNKAIAFYEKSLEIYHKILPPNHIRLAAPYNNIGLVYGNMGEYSKSLSYYERAHEIREKTLPPNHPSLGDSYNNIGLVYYSMGEYSKALLYYEKALEIREKTLPLNHPSLGASYSNIGIVYVNMDEYSKALSFYKIALEIEQKILPLNHPSLGDSYNNIGSVYVNMGEYSKAFSFYKIALEIKQKSLPPNHPSLGNSYNNIGVVYVNMGEHSKALSYHERALEIQQKTLPPNHPNLVTFYNNIGSVCCSMGEYSKALSYYEKALEIRQKTLPPNHPGLGASYYNIGTMYATMGDYPKAKLFLERAVNNGQQSLPPNHPDLQKFRENLDIVKKRLQFIFSRKTK